MDRIKQFLFKNSTTKQTIAKNTFWLFFGEILGRILKLGIIVFATRTLGTDGWGVFSYALASVSLFYMFSDIGINIFVTRQLSKEGDDRYDYIASAFFLKIAILTISGIVAIVAIPHIGSVALDSNIIVAIVLLNFSDSIREFGLSINRAFLKMEREALVKIVMNGLITLLGIGLLLLKPLPLSLALGYTIGSIIATMMTILLLIPECKKIPFHISLHKIKTIFTFSWPYLATVFFSSALFTIDSIMLGNMKSTTEVGLYAAAQRFIQFLAVIPLFIGMSLFPILSKNVDDPVTLKQFFEKAMTVVLCIGFPIAIGGALLSHDLMITMFGAAFVQGGIVLTILMFVIFADFPYVILSNVISAKNLQRKFILSTMAGLCINIGLNLYLIPTYGARGAAFATLIAQALIMTINWHLLKRYFSFSVVPKLGKIVLSTLLMACIILICISLGIPLIATIPIAMLVYVGVLYVTNEPVLILARSMIK